MEATVELMLKALVAVAWADGRMHAREAEVLQALVNALELSDADANELRKYAISPRTLDELPVAELSAPDRLTLLRHAVIVTYVDGEQTADEREALKALVTKLQIPEPDATQVIESAARRARRVSDLV